MKVSKRAALGAAAVAAAAFAIPASAGPGNPKGGTDQQSCADGIAAASPSVLWTPNHRMHDVTISYSAPDDSPSTNDTTTITVDSITDDQIIDGEELVGSGNPSEGQDWQGVGGSATSAEGQTASTTVQIRAERSGTVQAGRHYYITVSCTEKTGGTVPNAMDSGMATLTVWVPHDQRPTS